MCSPDAPGLKFGREAGFVLLFVSLLNHFFAERGIGFAIRCGKVGAIVTADWEDRDRLRGDYADLSSVNFTPMPAGFIPPFSAVSSIGVVVIERGDRLVVVKLERGWDIPGGHVKERDESMEATAKREVLEEACCTIEMPRVLQVTRSDLFGDAAETWTYIVVMVARLSAMLPFRKAAESTGRRIMGVDEFLEKYTAGPVDRMRETLAVALKAT